jgi:hypothetical protein
VARSGDMDQDEVEGKNRHDPSINAGARGDVGICEHAFDISSVDFHNEISNAYEIKSHSAEGAKESVNFEFCLRESCFSFVEGNGTKSAIETFAGIFDVALAEVETDGDVGSVDSKKYRGEGLIVDCAKCWGF